jgi:thymidylate synthase
MSRIDILYRNLITEILEDGTLHENRTGVNTWRIWGAMMRCDLGKGFPLLTQKKMAVKTAFTEMLGFVRGETDVRWYQERGCRIWDDDHARWHGKDLERDRARRDELQQMQQRDWVAKQVIEYTKPMVDEVLRLQESIAFRENNPHSLGYIYGARWRRTHEATADAPPVVDQLADIITALRAGSTSRRLIMSAWFPQDFHLMCLPPCHVLYHFSLRDTFLDVAMTQRSVDSALGLPMNLANTALLTHLIAHAANLTPGMMLWEGHDVHIYEPHVANFEQQFNQETYDAPTLVLNTAPGTMPWDTTYEDICLRDYQCSQKVPFQLFVG